MSFDRILRKPLLRMPLSHWAEQIERLKVQLEHKDPDLRLMILYQTRLANLIKYEPFQGTSDGKLILRDDIQISLCQVSENKQGRQGKLPSVAIDLASTWSADKAKLLHDAGIKYIKVPAPPISQVELSEIIQEITNIWIADVGYNALKSTALDRGEYGKTAFIQQRLLPLELRYLPQQALSSVLELPNDVREGIRSRVQSYNATQTVNDYKISEELDQITTVDGVVTTPPPACIPVAVVEFDGLIHQKDSTPDGRKKIEKDKIQNGIFEKAKLPLIRVAEGGRVDPRSEMLGEAVLDALLGDLKRLMADEEHQMLAAQEMLYAEVKDVEDPDRRKNLESLLVQTLKLLDEKAKVTEQRYSDSLHDLEQQVGGDDPSMHMSDHRDEPDWLLHGFTSEQESLKADFLHNYWYLVNEDLLISNFFERSEHVRKHRDIGWKLEVKYEPCRSGFEDVDNSLREVLEPQQFTTEAFIPLTISGSDEFKLTLKKLVQKFLCLDVLDFEKDLSARLIQPTAKALGNLAEEFWKNAFINKLRSAANSKAVAAAIESRIGLRRRRHRIRRRSDKEVELLASLRSSMLEHTAECVDALSVARPDYDSETIAMLREEFEQEIEEFVESVTFEVVEDSPENELRILTQ